MLIKILGFQGGRLFKDGQLKYRTVLFRNIMFLTAVSPLTTGIAWKEKTNIKKECHQTQHSAIINT